MVEDTLNLVEWWGFTIVVTDYKIFMDFSSFGEDSIRNEYTRPTSRRNCDRCQSLKGFIFCSSELFNQGRSSSSSLTGGGGWERRGTSGGGG